VKSIFIHNARFVGHLTPLGKLTEMFEFNLQGNQLSGSIPQSFFSMPKLPNLYLNDNQLTGSIPPITSVNRRLTVLSLENNRLEGSIPESLSMMKGLTRLNLGHNMLTGTIPVLDQRDLQDINLSENYLTMGSLEEVPMSTFSASASYIDLRSNCLVFRNPSRPWQNADATHCRGERVLQVRCRY
jgi:Leucine-rich repeat (LRR) protein